MIEHGCHAKKVLITSRTWFTFALGLSLTFCMAQPHAYGQTLEMPGEIGSSSVSSPSIGTVSPAQQPFSIDSAIGEAGHSTMNSGGAYYNPILGAHIRARYSTQSYGQDRGNLDLGTMKIWDQGDSVSFFDGQITLNEESHVGYNLGLGYRWMSLPMFPFSADDEKIMGVSLWADGQGAGGDNFFPQIGASFEMLGDRVDFRANGYLPVGSESKDRDFQATGETFFTGNNIADQLVGIRDTSLSVLEGELAGRISNYDAWVFGGVYGFTGGDNDEVGGKIGLRGYATPDLSLSIALTNDALFDTNAVFSATWFIGRTRRENCPTGQLRDRFREPVIRNDYVAMAQTAVIGSANALTDIDNELIRVVHVDSTADAGGDGTIENPYATLAQANGAGSMEGDIILAHAGSTFTDDSITLQDNQRLLGEGVVFDDGNALTTETNIDHTVIVFGGGSISLPETETGAFLLDAATVTNSAAINPTITLADNNEVNNLVIVGGENGIAGNEFTLDTLGAGTNGSGDSDLQNLRISGTTGDAIRLTMARRIDEDDATLATLEMDVNLNNIQLDDIGGTFGILIDMDDNGLSTDATTTALNESVTINNLDFANSSDASTAIGLQIQNTNNTNTLTSINDYTYDGGTTALGAVGFESVDGTVNVTGDTTFAGGGAAGTGINVSNSPALITFADTVEMNNVGGTGISVTGDTPNFIYNGSMTNADGDAVSIANINGGLVDITFEEGLTDTGTGISVDDIGEATVRFSSSDDTANTINSGANDAIEISNVTDAAARITFNDFEVTTTSARGVVAGVNNTDGTMEYNDLSVTTTSGEGIDIDQAVATDDFQSIFNGLQVATDSGNAITAVQGNLTVAAGTDSNTITTNTGTALNLNNTTVNGGVTFDTVDVTNATDFGIELNDVGDGPVTIGTNTGTDGEGGTIGATVSAVKLSNVSDFTISDVIISASGSPAIDIEKTGEETGSATINNVQTPDGTTSSIANALTVNQFGTGDQSVTITDSDFNGTTGDAVLIDNVEGAVSISDTNIDDSGARALVFNEVEGNVSLSTISADNAVGDAASFTASTGTTTVTELTIEGGSARGVFIDNSDGNFTFDSTSSITDQDGIALDVQGGEGTVTYNGSIENTTGNSISVTNKSAGGVNFAPSATANITDSGEGIIVSNNTGGNYNFLGNHDLDTTTNDAVTVTNNTGATVTFSDLDINTTTGGGFVATGGGTIGVNTDSTVTTTTGVGVQIDGMTVANTGVTFDSVNVTTKADTSAVLIDGTTGGSIAINGGTIADSTNDAIIINDASTVVLDGITVTASDAGAINATDVSLLTVDDVTVTNSTSDAITATNVGTMIMNGTTVTNTGGNAFTLVNDDAVNMDIRIDDFTVTAATAAAINATHTGSGRFDLELDNSNLDEQVAITATGTGAFDLFATNTTIDDLDNEVAFFLNMDGGAMNDVDISLSNVDIATGDAIAFDLDAINGTNLNIAFELSGGSSITNNSASSAFDGLVGSSTNLDATILGNTFTNNGGGGPFVLETNNASAQVQMEITGNTFAGGGLTLTDNGGDFQVENSATISADNGGVVVSTPGSGTIDEFDETIEVIEAPVAND